jgi:hypothetical protein
MVSTASPPLYCRLRDNLVTSIILHYPALSPLSERSTVTLRLRTTTLQIVSHGLKPSVETVQLKHLAVY